MSKTNEFGDFKNIPSNEELVDSLMEDFKNTCILKPKDDEKISGEQIGSTSTCEESNIPGLDNADETKSDVQEKPKPHDYIDEEELKAKETSYTEEDRIRLKGESDELKNKGNALFKVQEYKESADAYTGALRTCPQSYPKDRAILYANRGAAKMKLGFSESAIEDCTSAIELDPTYFKAILRRAQLNEAADKLEEALEDFKKILELDPANVEANHAVRRLPDLINEKNEKLKAEMLGKLKELGNVILRPFGLSTNNFQMVQDPNTGGYSINFKN